MGFGDDIHDPHTGIERRERVLEDHLHLPTIAVHCFARTNGGEFTAREMNPPGRRLIQTGNCLGHGRLPRSAFSDEPEDLTLLDLERNVIDRIQVSPVGR